MVDGISISMIQNSGPVLKNSDCEYPIFYYQEADCEGFYTRREFAALIMQHGLRQRYYRLAEWCCGAGANGFYMLEANLCTNLVLVDCWEPAIAGCDFTAAANGIGDCVTTYCADRLDQLPDHEIWDCVIVAPPWRPEIWPGPGLTEHILRKKIDQDWALHNHMYEHLPNRLALNAEVWVFEDHRFRSPQDWHSSIQQAGLELVGVHENFWQPTSYVLHLQKTS